MSPKCEHTCTYRYTVCKYNYACSEVYLIVCILSVNCLYIVCGIVEMYCLLYTSNSSTFCPQTNGSLLDSPIMSRSSTLQSVSSSTTEGSPTSSPRSSITSLLEECFDVISQLGPESLIFSTLMKKLVCVYLVCVHSLTFFS